MARLCCIASTLLYLLSPSPRAVAATACEHRLQRLADAGDRAAKLGLAKKLGPFLRGLRGAEKRVCAQQVERALRGLLVSWAQKRSAAAQHTLAIAQLWLDLFPRHDKAPLVRFARAGALYELTRYRAAALAYGALEGLPADKRKAALRRAVLAWQKHLAQTRPGQRQRRPARATKPRRIADKKAMFAAFDAFVALAPKSAEAITVRFRKARLLYDHNHLDAAAQHFLQLAEQHPRHALAASAAQLALDALDRQGKTKELTRRAKALLARPALARGRLGQTLQQVYLTGLFKRAEASSRQGRYAEGGRRYLEVVKAGPKHRLAPMALYNAAFCFERAKQITAAISAREQLLRCFDKATVAQRTRFLLAGNYHQRKDHRRAAALYVAYAGQAKANDRDAAQGLVYAITVQMRAGQRRRARELFRTLERIAPRHRRLVDQARAIVH